MCLQNSKLKVSVNNSLIFALDMVCLITSGVDRFENTAEDYLHFSDNVGHTVIINAFTAEDFSRAW